MPELEPITREEKLLDGEDLTPITRKEMFIKRIYDKTQSVPEPITREEMFLKKAGEGGGGDVTIEQLDVSENGTYSESGKAYSPVVVNVPLPQNAYLLKSVANLPQAIASFTDGADAPMKSLKVAIEPQQDLHGYDAPWVGGAGKNKFDIDNVNSSYWNVSGEQITNAVTDTRQNFQLVVQGYYNNQATKVTYLQKNITTTGRVSFTFTIGNNDNVDQLLVKHNGVQRDIIISFVNWTQKGDVTLSFDIIGHNPTVVGGIVFSNIQIESGSTATTFAPYSNICPISGYTEVDVTVADDVENPTVSNVYTIDLDGTRYGGEVDVVNGIVTPAPYYASYNGETLTGEWISDRDKYEVGATPTIGAQVVNIGASGTPVSILPTAIKSLRGVNNIYANTGDIKDAEYFSKEV